MAYRIDLSPPSMSGKPEEDVKRLQDYIVYLHEQLNFIISQLEREINEINQGG